MRILVLGGGYAGVLAALRLANRGLGAQVTLVNASPEFVERIRHHELGAGTPPRRRPLGRLLGPVALEVGRVRRIDLARQVAALEDGRELAWDRLVYALGSVADDGGVPGARVHAIAIGDEAGARALQQARAAGARELVVVGGGLSGVEIAAELAENGARVTLVAAGGVGSFLSTESQEYLRGALARLEVRVVNARVREVRANEVVLDGESLRCDACVWAGGFRAPSLAGESGLQVNPQGQVVVDERLRSRSHPNVYAVGDACECAFDAGSPIRLGCKYAMPMAAHAADNLWRAATGRNERAFEYGDTGFCISLGRRDGLVQVNRADASPQRVLRGRLAAWVKEQICRYTVWALQLERWFVFYRWRRPPRRALSGVEQKKLVA